MSAILPVRLSDGKAVQARASLPTVPTSTTVAETPAAALDALAATATKGFPPEGVTAPAKTRSLLVAPTAIAEGAVAGDDIVFGSGPEFPAATTTMTPAS